MTGRRAASSGRDIEAAAGIEAGGGSEDAAAMPLSLPLRSGTVQQRLPRLSCHPAVPGWCADRVHLRARGPGPWEHGGLGRPGSRSRRLDAPPACLAERVHPERDQAERDEDEEPWAERRARECAQGRVDALGLLRLVPCGRHDEEDPRGGEDRAPGDSTDLAEAFDLSPGDGAGASELKPLAG